MVWKVTLLGGPFDGDSAHIKRKGELPAKLWVERCPKGDRVCFTHWYTSRAPGCDVYRKGEVDEPEHAATYVHADLDASDPDSVSERELLSA